MPKADMVLAIDPGTTQSAWVLLGRDGRIGSHQISGNPELVALLKICEGASPSSVLAVEMIASYGMPVGKEVFETCVWIGRFVQAWKPRAHAMIYRRDVKMHLCGNVRAKDSNIRQALIDRYGPGKETAIGKKASPGPLYGFKKDLWAALAVAVTFADNDEDFGATK